MYIMRIINTCVQNIEHSVLIPLLIIENNFCKILFWLKEELDEIIRYGSKELFADENDEAGKSRQIHYDDAAIDRYVLVTYVPRSQFL